MDSHEAKLRSKRFLIFLQSVLVIQHLTKNEEIFKLQMQDQQQAFNQFLNKN
ncbi:MAG: hypothetical protein ACI8PW_000339 [Methylophilaceae bacterium]|jgi:hypothetical protein